MNEVPDGFRETPLGPLPETWETAAIGELGEVVTGRTPSTREPRYWNGAIPFVTPSDLQGGSVRSAERTITETGLEVSRALPRGTVAVSCIGYIGKVGVIDTAVAVTNQQINAVIPERSRVTNWFLAYAMTHLEPTLNNRARMTTVPILNKSNFAEVPVPLPPLPEQRAIAGVLRTVQRAREATEDVIAAARELKRSLMRHLFTYGPVPVDQAEQVELKETPLGCLPEGWRVVRLDEVAQTTSGGTPDRSCPAYYGGGIPWVKSGELNDSVVRSTGETITELGLVESNAKLLSEGTLLLAMYGATAGTVGILRGKAATNQAICAITPADQALPEYLFHALVHRRKNLMGERYGGAQPNLSQRLIRAFQVPLPPLPEQRQIARILCAVDAKVAAEEARRDALDELFRTLLHHLMTGRVRVPIRETSEVFQTSEV